MIPINAFKDLFMAMPSSRITEPIYYCHEHKKEKPSIYSEIVDKSGNNIGLIDWKNGVIEIFDSYEYADEVMESIGKDKFTDITDKTHYDYEKHSEQLDQENTEKLEEIEELTKEEGEQIASVFSQNANA